MGKRESYEAKTTELIQPVVEANGVELFDVDYVKEGSDWYLRVYIDKEGGVTIDDCQNVSRAFNEILDRENYIDDQYIFEVSSPAVTGQASQIIIRADRKRELRKAQRNEVNTNE